MFSQRKEVYQKGGYSPKHTTSHISRNDLPGRVSIFGNFEVFGFLKILFSENAEQNFSQDGFRRTEFFQDGFRRKCRAEQILKDALARERCD